MIEIKYKIKNHLKQIYVVIVPNNYTRAMLFLRVQEFYESSNKRFRRRNFSFWDYKKWYSEKNDGAFTYPKDWSGFNFPLRVALKCKSVSKVETPYDNEMNKIINLIKKSSRGDCYVVGVESEDTSVYKHEVSHALYYTNKDYREQMDSLTSTMNRRCFGSICKSLKDLGYCEGVLKDEIQAYIATGNKESIFKGIKVKPELVKKYKQVFAKEYREFKKTVGKC